MKKSLLYILTVLLLVALCSIQTKAQITLQVGAGLGYSLPAGDYAGTTVDFYNGAKFGMKSGFNLNGKVRVGIRVLNAFGEIDYNAFSGSGESEPGQGSIDLSNKVISVKVGPELPFSIPMSPVTPYIQGFVSYNNITGTAEFKGVSDVPSGKYDIASASRIGLGVGVGAIIDLVGIKLDANIQYHFINIGGKEYKIENATSHERLDNYTSLNDSKDPLYNVSSTDHFIANDRGISAVEFKLDVMFGL